MSRPLVVHVEGLPVSKGSLSAVETPAGPRLIEKKSSAARRKLKDWREAVRVAAYLERTRVGWDLIGALRRHFLRPVEVELNFYLPRPKSIPSYVRFPATFPDQDKLERAVLDELSESVYRDDRQICRCDVTKEYASERHPAGVVIVVQEVTKAWLRA